MSRFLLHCLLPLHDRLEAYRATGDARILGEVRGAIQAWRRHCLWAESDRLIWDDHVTALRALVLCRAWGVLRTHEPPASPFMTLLFGALDRHAERLALERFYRAEHNHGVTQAYALLALGLVLSAHPEAEHWTRLGLARLEAQMAANVTAEGLHREHSPAYHFFVLQQFHAAASLAEAWGLGLSAAYEDRLCAMLRSGAHLLKPDGTVAALGDSSRSSPLWLGEEDLLDWPAEALKPFDYARTGGRHGTAPAERSVTFPAAGYAVLRSGWGEQEPLPRERYVVVRLATHPTTHLHRDVLSFELYAYGDDLLVDSGGPYLYGHPLRRQYFCRTAAHNTVVVDGADQAVGAARVLAWEVQPGHDLLLAEHGLYAGVRHRRAFLLVRGRYLLVLDLLEAVGRHRFASLFHLSPALTPELDRAGITTTSATAGATVQLVPLLRDHLDVDLVTGRRSPPQGWVSLAEGQAAPAAVVAWQREGRQAAFATLVVPAPPGPPPPVEATLEGVPLAGPCRFEVTLEGRRDRIALSPSGALTISGGPA